MKTLSLQLEDMLFKRFQLCKFATFVFLRRAASVASVAYPAAFACSSVECLHRRLVLLESHVVEVLRQRETMSTQEPKERTRGKSSSNLCCGTNTYYAAALHRRSQLKSRPTSSTQDLVRLRWFVPTSLLWSPYRSHWSWCQHSPLCWGNATDMSWSKCFAHSLYERCNLCLLAILFELS